MKWTQTNLRIFKDYLIFSSPFFSNPNFICNINFCENFFYYTIHKTHRVDKLRCPHKRIRHLLVRLLLLTLLWANRRYPLEYRMYATPTTTRRPGSQLPSIICSSRSSSKHFQLCKLLTTLRSFSLGEVTLCYLLLNLNLQRLIVRFHNFL